MINNVILVGRITKDIDLKTSNNSGKHYCTFTLAVNRPKTQNGNQEADFITCKAFNNTAKNLASYCGRGSLIGVEGSIQTGNYQDQNGNTVYTFSVLANRVQFIESKKQQQNNNQNVSYNQPNNNFNNNQNFGYNQPNNNFNNNQNFNNNNNNFNNNQNSTQDNSVDFFEAMSAMNNNFNNDYEFDKVNPFKE